MNPCPACVDPPFQHGVSVEPPRVRVENLKLVQGDWQAFAKRRNPVNLRAPTRKDECAIRGRNSQRGEGEEGAWLMKGRGMWASEYRELGLLEPVVRLPPLVGRLRGVGGAGGVVESATNGELSP